MLIVLIAVIQFYNAQMIRNGLIERFIAHYTHMCMFLKRQMFALYLNSQLASIVGSVSTIILSHGPVSIGMAHTLVGAVATNLNPIVIH